MYENDWKRKEMNTLCTKIKIFSCLLQIIVSKMVLLKEISEGIWGKIAYEQSID